MNQLYKIAIFSGLLLTVCCSLSASQEEEAKLIATLQGDASTVEKCSAAQRLRVVGTVKAVPALAGVLAHPDVSHAARYALEGMSYGEAIMALRQGLGRATGDARLGIIDSLGWRRDTGAVAFLAPLTTEPDKELSSAAATALGRIANPEARKALIEAKQKSPGEARSAVLDALLCCAGIELNEGRTEEALATYRLLFAAENPPHIRAAAWRGIASADKRNRPKLIADALAGADADVQAAACSAVRSMADSATVKECVRSWDRMPETAQVAVMDAHNSLGKGALRTVRLAAKSQHPKVRIAAWQALGEIGEAEDIKALASATSSTESGEAAAAISALTRINAPKVDRAIIQLLDKVNPETQAILLRAFGDRGDASAAPLLLRYAEQGTGQGRLAALDSLRKLSAPETAVPLLKLAAICETEAGLQPVMDALLAVCENSEDKQDLAAKMLPVFENLPLSGKRNVLPMLARLETPGALQAALKAAEGSDPELAKAAVRALTEWPSAAPAERLLALAKTSPDASIKILALRGAISTAAHEPDPAKRLALLKSAMDAAQRTEEKVQALGQVGQIASPGALSLALAALNDKALENEAGLTAITIAEKLAPTHPSLAKDTAAAVLKRSKTPELVKRAWAINKPTASAPFIQHWVVSGPFRKPGLGDAISAMRTPLGPEIQGQEVKWYSAPAGDQINFLGLFSEQQNCAGFAKALVVAPAASEAILLLGSDDGIKAWVNGKIVHENNVDRGMVPDQDVASIALKQGVNELMLKVSQGGGGWSACARIVGPDGQTIQGLHSVAQADVAAAVPPAKVAPPTPVAAALPPKAPFQTVRLSPNFYAEGAYYADFNKDGNMDVVAGPYWFAGPDFREQNEYRSVKVFNAPTEYSDNFLTFAGDFNNDSWPDILFVPFPGKEGYWYENPAGKTGHWEQHLAYPNIGNESPIWEDVNGDGRNELVFNNDGFLGYLTPNPLKADEPWTFHPISTQDKRYQRFTHGVGCGDINGDSRADIVEAVGWWEQPATANVSGPWKFHPFHFADAAAQILVYDVNGDGRSDIITAWHCHLYGLVWWKQVKSGENIGWEQNVILPSEPDVASTEFRVSQLHAFELVDMNGDGLKDILTGKRFWAHGPTGDKEPDAPAVVFWFELKRQGNDVSFTPRLIHDDSGVGTQVAATDLNKDNRPDVIVANKKGVFLHLTEK